MSAPHVNNAAAVPATTAMPASAKRRGTGMMAPMSAGSQRNVYHSGQAPCGFQSQRPPIAATAPQEHAPTNAGVARCGSEDPRTSAAARRMKAIAVTASAACHDNHKTRLTPPAGGAIPRPKYRTM